MADGPRPPENRDTLHNYGVEVDKASYVYIGANQIFNHSISGMWIGNGANHITIENDTVYNNGLNGVQIAGSGRLAPVTAVSIIGLTSQHNDQQRSSGAPYPTLPRFFGVMIQDGGAGREVCIQSDSNLVTNARGAVYSEGSYSRWERLPAALQLTSPASGFQTPRMPDQGSAGPLSC